MSFRSLMNFCFPKNWIKRPAKTWFNSSSRPHFSKSLLPGQFKLLPVAASSGKKALNQRRNVPLNKDFNYAETDGCIGVVVPVAHPSRFINFLFLNHAPHLLDRVWLNKLSVSRLCPKSCNYSDIITSVQHTGLQSFFNSSRSWKNSDGWDTRIVISAVVQLKQK